MVPNRTKWYLIVPNGIEWYEMVRDGTQWYQMVPKGTKRYPMVTNGTMWWPMVPNSTQWYHTSVVYVPIHLAENFLVGLFKYSISVYCIPTAPSSNFDDFCFSLGIFRSIGQFTYSKIDIWSNAISGQSNFRLDTSHRKFLKVDLEKREGTPKMNLYELVGW